MNRKLKKKSLHNSYLQIFTEGSYLSCSMLPYPALSLDLILPAALAACVVTASLVLPIRQRALTRLCNPTPSRRASRAVRWRSNSIHLVPSWQELITEIILAYVLTSFLSLPNGDLSCFCSTALLDGHSGARKLRGF